MLRGIVAACLLALALVPAGVAGVDVVAPFPLERYAEDGAVGLLAPGAGPRVSREAALAALLRGRVEHSSLGGVPDAPTLIALGAPGSPAIRLALPAEGEQPNDRRYPIAVVGSGFRGILVSESTRIPGLVSVADVAPTWLGRENGLEWRAHADAPGYLRALDRRIRDKNDARLPASLVLAGVLALLVVVWPRAAVGAVGAAMAANLAVGVAAASEPWLLVATIGAAALGGGLLLARLPDLWLAAVLAGVIAAYLVATAADATTVALSPLGPTQTGRFYGFNNLLATLALPVVLGASTLLATRIGVAATAAVGAVALVAIGGNRFGADGGGAIVTAVALIVLVLRLRGGLSRRGMVVAVAGGVAAAAVLLAMDGATGGSSHVTEAVGAGPRSLAGDIADRLEISVRRTAESPGAIAIVVAGAAVFAWFALRSPRFPASDAMVVAILVSLVVNDTPSDVAGFGALGLAALWRWHAARAEEAPL